MHIRTNVSLLMADNDVVAHGEILEVVRKENDAVWVVLPSGLTVRLHPDQWLYLDPIVLATDEQGIEIMRGPRSRQHLGWNELGRSPELASAAYDMEERRRLAVRRAGDRATAGGRYWEAARQSRAIHPSEGGVLLDELPKRNQRFDGAYIAWADDGADHVGLWSKFDDDSPWRFVERPVAGTIP